MKTIDLASMHAKAGERYSAAIKELCDSYVELIGIGEAATNGNVAAISDLDRIVPSVPLSAPTHHQYAPKPINNNMLHTAAHERAAELLTELGVAV